MFITLWIGFLELSTGIIKAVNAGHEYPFIYRNNKGYELLKDRHNMVVGALMESKYEEYEIRMEKGDKIFLYTDGIPEAMDRYRRQFGLNALLETLNRTKDKDPENTLIEVRKAVADFVKDAEQFDDLTMMCVKYNGKDQV